MSQIRELAEFAQFLSVNASSSNVSLNTSALTVGNVTISNSSIITTTAELSTTATTGFLYIPTCNGTPTGIPTSFTGTVPIVLDTANNKLYFYFDGWKTVVPSNTLVWGT